MIGRSDAFLEVVRYLDKTASCRATLLIEGETGTGKDLVARTVHYGSERRDHPFIPVNCGALPDSLLENELFGHARGAYTDARSDQPGLIELAEKGTLFLDEVDALTPRAQVTLLRFLQDQRYRPLGGRRERSADVRIVAASNRSLEALAEQGEFRLDLLYRLRLLHLRVPPLRERHGDVALLASHFADLAGHRFGGVARPIHPDSLAWMDRYAWPGNVRELENLVYQAFLVSEEEFLHVPRPGSAGAIQVDEDLNYLCAKARAIASFEVDFLNRAMRRASGNVSAAARLIGTERRHLGRLLKKYGIERT